MYTIYVNGQPLHHPNLRSENRVVPEAKLREEVNTHGSLDTVVEMNNPLWGMISANDPVQVRETDYRTGSSRVIWRGRIASRTQGLFGSQSVHCEGKLAYLCDSFIEPFVLRGDVPDVMQALITKHNMAVGWSDTERVLSLGTVDVTDPNGSIYRFKESSQSIWDAIQEHLVKSSLGGYILFDPVTQEVGYYSSYARVCSQPVRFGVNLIDCAQTDDGTGIINALYAFGAENDEEHTEPMPEPDPTYSPLAVWYGNRVHLGSGKFPLIHSASVAKFGKHYGTMVWDDITTTSALETAALAFLSENWAKVGQRRIEVRAIDMSIADRELDDITVGALVNVIPPNLWGLDKNDFSNAVQLLCVARDLDIVEPDNSVYSFGTVEATLSSLVGG